MLITYSKIYRNDNLSDNTVSDLYDTISFYNNLFSCDNTAHSPDMKVCDIENAISRLKHNTNDGYDRFDGFTFHYLIYDTHTLRYYL